MAIQNLAHPLGLAGLCILAATGAATAGPPCAPRDQVLAQLAATYAESRRALGVSANNLVMEIFAAEGSGTWTITVTTPEGLTCLVASGEGFQPVSEDPPAKGDPA